MALLLAAVEIYGVLAGSVNERTREIAIRSAPGAPRSGLLGMVVRQGLGLAKGAWRRARRSAWLPCGALRG